MEHSRMDVPHSQCFLAHQNRLHSAVLIHVPTALAGDHRDHALQHRRLTYPSDLKQQPDMRHFACILLYFLQSCANEATATFSNETVVREARRFHQGTVANATLAGTNLFEQTQKGVLGKNKHTHTHPRTHAHTHTLAQKQLIELLMWNASHVQKHFS